MVKYTTKYFGEISIDETSDFEFIELVYKNKEIIISLHECNIYGNKLKVCLEIIDKYEEIDKIAKKAIVENFSKNKIIEDYFRCHFDELEEEKIIEIFGMKDFEFFDIEKTVGKFGYPNFLFGIDDGEINLSVDYMISKEYSDQILCVKMDEELNVTGYSHES
ncbi:MAG: DUF2004 domain-containing protein [Campylobacteraceae bacterium]|jgi:hypothetical protein|nr:DUF2004 domain-containing protein [Campylobacteraceae bacterium]